MADAIYNFIAAGVPHRVSQVNLSDAEFESLGFLSGRVTILSDRQLSQLENRFEYQTSAESGVAVRLAVDLACLGSQVAVLDLGSMPTVIQFPRELDSSSLNSMSWHANQSNTAKACRYIFYTQSRAAATAIYYGSVDSLGMRHSTMAGRSSKILCLEDRLWDVVGGAKFAAMAIDVAKSAGRTTMLVCKDSECVFRNRDAIRNISDKGIDYLVGDSEAVLLLHKLNRLDSLVPRLRALSVKAILWRSSHAPLIIEEEIAGWTQAIGKISAAEFWTSFLPACVSQISIGQQLNHPGIAGGILV
jgi:hypothetical protein